MHNHFISIGFLAVIVFITLVFGFYFTGSPLSQRGVNYDNQRLNDFSNINYAIEDYFKNNKSLPDSLSVLKNSEKIKDPETEKPYDYSILTDTKYKLCTAFSVDSVELEKKLRGKARTERYNYFSSNYYDQRKHKKGYDCIEYELSDNLIKQLSTPTPFNPPEVAETEARCKNYQGIWKNNSCTFTSCKDSDNTYGSQESRDSSKFIKGDVTFGPALVTDYCYNTSVVEYECVDNAADSTPGYYVRALRDTCPKGCLDGACIR